MDFILKRFPVGNNFSVWKFLCREWILEGETGIRKTSEKALWEDIEESWTSAPAVQIVTSRWIWDIFWSESRHSCYYIRIWGEEKERFQEKSNWLDGSVQGFAGKHSTTDSRKKYVFVCILYILLSEGCIAHNLQIIIKYTQNAFVAFCWSLVSIASLPL